MRSVTHVCWPRLLIAAVLFVSMLPLTAAIAPAQPVAAQTTTDSLCDGSPSADYGGPCGPSLTLPAWSDIAGWDDPAYADSITLVDLDLDGKDELIGRSPQGLIVNTWSADWGQWVPASDLTKPLPFGDAAGWADPKYGSTIQFGHVSITSGADGLQAVAVGRAAGGLETWSWHPGDGSPGAGSWTRIGQNGPYGDSASNGTWTDPAYYSTIQFAAPNLGDFTFKSDGQPLIARTSTGIELCQWWTPGTPAWSCYAVGSIFSDSLITGADGSLAPYYYDTIQFGDIYGGNAGPELFGRDNQGGGTLKVYTWDDTSISFVELKPSGNWPFWTPSGSNGWDDVKYSSTIQPVQLVAKDTPQQVIGRSAVGLQWFTIAESGCGGHTAPCWKNITNFTGQPLSDYDGFNDPQYYETMNFADLSGDGLDELVVRTPQLGSATTAGLMTVWQLHASAGWTLLSTPAPNLQAGPAADPLWSDPGYYQTIQVGVATDDHRPTLIARGKYGVRTWQFWTNSGWWRPYPYGHGNTSQGEQPASDVANYFSTARGILANLYFQDSFDVDQAVQELFPGTPDGDTHVDGDAYKLFAGLRDAVSSQVGASALALNTDLHTVYAALAAMPSIQAGDSAAMSFKTSLDDLDTAFNPLAAEALARHDAIYSYISGDAGLLALYDAMVKQGLWDLTTDNTTLVTSIGQHNSATWLYQTVLPSLWRIWVCQPGDSGYCDFFDDIANGVNALEVGVGDWKTLLGEHGLNGVNHGKAIKADNPTFERVFGEIQSTCAIRASGSAAWSYQGCNLGATIQEVLFFQDGWTTFDCTVINLNNVGTFVPGDPKEHDCGDGSPDGYGP